MYEDHLMSQHMRGKLNYRNHWPLLVLRKDFANQMQHKICKEYIARNYASLYRKEHTLEEKIQFAKPRIDTGLSKIEKKQPVARPKSAVSLRNV